MERIKISDKHGKYLGTHERSSILEDIVSHSLEHGDAPSAVPVVHVILADQRKRIYTVQRSFKTEDAFLWDVTAAGYRQGDEPWPKTVRRECLEEIGVKIKLVSHDNYEEALHIYRNQLRDIAVVRLVDIDTWRKSERVNRELNHWTKRLNLHVYMGRYTGKLTFKDAEAVSYEKLTLPALAKKISRFPGNYGDNIKTEAFKYAHLL